MERFPPIPPSKLSPEQKEIHDEMLDQATKGFSGKGFTYQRADGAMVGPFAPLLYTPAAVARHFLGVSLAIGSIPDFPPSAKETAILTTGALFGCHYERYAHENLAETTGALRREQTMSLSKGEKPKDADEGVSVAFDVASALVEERGPLREELWGRAKGCFGEKGALALVHYVGAYCYVCVLLNGADVPVPK